jgi:hypothetical protein
MRFTHVCDAARHLLQRTMEPYFTANWRQMRWPGLAGRRGDYNVGRNPQLPPRLAALQREPEGALSARRPRIGRYRHYAVGHSAHCMGKRRPRKLKRKTPASAGFFLSGLGRIRFCVPQKGRSDCHYRACTCDPPRRHSLRDVAAAAFAPQGLSDPGGANTFAPWPTSAFKQCT